MCSSLQGASVGEINLYLNLWTGTWQETDPLKFVAEEEMVEKGQRGPAGSCCMDAASRPSWGGDVAQGQ